MTTNNNASPSITPDRVREILKNVIDPELGYNIVDLGLIYNVTVDPDMSVHVLATLTSPGCPLSHVIEKEVKDKVLLIEGVKDIELKITFSPPWTPAKAAEDLKREFALMGIPVTEE